MTTKATSTTLKKFRKYRTMRAKGKAPAKTGGWKATMSKPTKKKPPTFVPPPPRKPKIDKVVAELLESFFHLPIDQYTPGSVLCADLGADDLDVIELVMMLEEKFSISLDALEEEHDVEELTVGHVLDALIAAGAIKATTTATNGTNGGK